MNDDQKTRPSLLIKLRDPQNRESWNQFLETYGPLILRCLRRIGVSEQDVVDLSQDVLRIVIRRMPTFQYDPQKRFRGWLKTVVRNRAIRYFRQRRRQPQPVGAGSASDLVCHLPDPHAPLDDWIEEESRRRRLELAMKKVRSEVKPQTWKVFELRALEHRSSEEVAKQLNISTGTVYTDYFRVLQRLRAAVEEIDE